jgi:TonB family protein
MVDLFFKIVLNNVFISLALAIIAAIVGKSLKRPAIAYLLWLLVFVKLLTPPFLMIPVHQDLWMGESAPAIDLNVSELKDINFVENREIGSTTSLSPAAVPAAQLKGQHWLLIAWILGSMAVLMWSTRQVIRFHRLLKKEAEAGGPEIQLAAAEIANSLGLKIVPEIHTVSANISPMVWWIGGKVWVMIPAAILKQLSAEQSKWILSHELAHVRRRDYMIRWIEWLVCVCFWWNPVAWWARYNLRANEELCCDAMVLSIMKPKPYTYGDSLLKAIEILTGPPRMPLAMASGINNSSLLKGRIKMIVSNDLIKSKMRWLQTCVILGALIVIPLGLTNAQSSVENGSPSEFKGIYAAVTYPSDATISVEAQAALVEADRRLNTNPEDFAAAREPLIEFMETHSNNSVPETLYMMLGQLWYIDQEDEEHLENANWIYETAYEIYPDETSFLLNYAVTTYELGQYEDAAALFEDYYNLDENHDVQFLENAAGLYMAAGNEEEAQRLVDLLPASEQPVHTVHPPLPEDAEAALTDAQQLIEANPDNFAAARKPLIDFMGTHSGNSVPKQLYMMLGQLWHSDKGSEGYLEMAGSVFETAYETYPDETVFLFNYAMTLYDLEKYEDAAALFEKYYLLDESHDVQILENAAAIYEMAGNDSDAERIRSQLADISQASGHSDKTREDLPISDDAPALLSDVDTTPKVLEAFPPLYPDDAKANGIEGKVVVQFVVDTDGYATEPEILEATPPDIFDDAALEAITQYRFQPATKDGMRVACIAKLAIGFAIE